MLEHILIILALIHDGEFIDAKPVDVAATVEQCIDKGKAMGQKLDIANMHRKGNQLQIYCLDTQHPTYSFGTVVNYN